MYFSDKKEILKKLEHLDFSGLEVESLLKFQSFVSKHLSFLAEFKDQIRLFKNKKMNFGS